MRVTLSNSERAVQWSGLLADWLKDNADGFTMSELQNIATTVIECGAMKLNMGAGGVFTLARDAAQGAHITPDRFAGFPCILFQIRERRSFTVHLEDAGKFDVFAEQDPNSDRGPVHAGRYDTFGEAATVCDGLNRVWRSAPQSTAAEVLTFVGRTVAPDLNAVLLQALQHLAKYGRNCDVKFIAEQALAKVGGAK